jgi:hypothetical protein
LPFNNLLGFVTLVHREKMDGPCRQRIRHAACETKKAADQARAENERPIRLVALLGVDATPGTYSILPSGQVFKVKSLESCDRWANSVKPARFFRPRDPYSIARMWVAAEPSADTQRVVAPVRVCGKALRPFFLAPAQAPPYRREKGDRGRVARAGRHFAPR